MLKYTADHEYLRLEGKTATVGITHHAQEALGDLVFVELPKVGRSVKKGEAIATLESVKAASEVFAPVTGTIEAVNQAIVDAPNLVNDSPEDKAWFFKIVMSDESEIAALLDEAAYKKLIA